MYALRGDYAHDLTSAGTRLRARVSVGRRHHIRAPGRGAAGGPAAGGADVVTTSDGDPGAQAGTSRSKVMSIIAAERIHSSRREISAITRLAGRKSEELGRVVPEDLAL